MKSIQGFFATEQTDEELESLVRDYSDLEYSGEMGICKFREAVEGFWGTANFLTMAQALALALWKEKAKRLEDELTEIYANSGHT